MHIFTFGSQDFTLKTTPALGDPADGGLIGCIALGNAGQIVAPTFTTGITWGGYGTLTNATSTVDGAANTSSIVSQLGSGTYAARYCYDYATKGGYTDGWFLPAQSQLNCLAQNRASIGGISFFFYWSSTEGDAFNAFSQAFFAGNPQNLNAKNNLVSVAARCVRPLE